MSKLDYLGLRIYLKRVEESLTERLARIEAEANPSQDDATVAAVERMLASKHQEAEDEDIKDDFAGGTSGIDGSPWLMTWRSHLAEFILRLKEDGYETCAAHLERLADVNSLKKPFTAADEADVIKSILEYLAALRWLKERPVKAVQATTGGGGGGQGSWRGAQAYLEGCRLKGEPFTTQEKMAERVGCSPATINKAIQKGSVELQEWAAKQHTPSRLNVSPEAAAVALETTPQSREPDPGDVAEQYDVDVCMRFLIEQAKRTSPEAAADTAARIQAMDPAKQRELAEMTYRDPDKAEQIERRREAEKQRRRD